MFFVPVQIALCMVFLYKVLGWRFACAAYQHNLGLTQFFKFIRGLGGVGCSLPNTRACRTKGPFGSSYGHEDGKALFGVEISRSLSFPQTDARVQIVSESECLLNAQTYFHGW